MDAHSKLWNYESQMRCLMSKLNDTNKANSVHELKIITNDVQKFCHRLEYYLNNKMKPNQNRVSKYCILNALTSITLNKLVRDVDSL